MSMRPVRYLGRPDWVPIRIGLLIPNVYIIR
jgi:hypothetical protein